MTVEKINQYIPNNWLETHWDEFITLAGKITRTLIISTAVEKKWTNPMKTAGDFKLFFEDEAKQKKITATEVEYFFFEAGRLKARNYIFEKHCVPLLPKNETGENSFTMEMLLSFVNSTVAHADLLKS